VKGQEIVAQTAANMGALCQTQIFLRCYLKTCNIPIGIGLRPVVFLAPIAQWSAQRVFGTTVEDVSDLAREEFSRERRWIHALT
jgi:hypothetical protein